MCVEFIKLVDFDFQLDLGSREKLRSLPTYLQTPVFHSRVLTYELPTNKKEESIYRASNKTKRVEMKYIK